MSRLIARLLAVIVAASTCAVAASAPAAAIAATMQGWWSATNPGAIPEVGASPATPPAPPDVPADGLFVEGGQDPTVNPDALAFAALVYDVAPGTTATTLTLVEAPGSAAAPGTTLKLCPLVVAVLRPEQGGPMSDAPDYRCATSVAARADASGAFSFAVATLVHDDVLAVAILPTAATDRAALARPDASSLKVQTATPSPHPATTSARTTGVSGTGPSSPAASPAAPPAGTAGPAPGGLVVGDVGALPAPEVRTAVASGAPTPLVAGEPRPGTDATIDVGLAPSSASANTAAPSSGASRWPAGVLVAALLVAVVLWTYAGRAPRSPSDELPNTDG